MYEDYYSEPEEHRVLKHSGFGIASFAIALAAGTLEFIIVVAAGIVGSLTSGGVDENSPIILFLGTLFIGGLFLDLLGIILGIIGLCQRRRKKVFAVLGVVIGSLVFAGILFVIVLGAVLG